VKSFLESKMGKEIDVHCGGATISGRVMLIEENVLYLEKDNVTCYVNIDRIIAVWDSREKKANPPGFVIKAS